MEWLAKHHKMQNQERKQMMDDLRNEMNKSTMLDYFLKKRREIQALQNRIDQLKLDLGE